MSQHLFHHLGLHTKLMLTGIHNTQTFCTYISFSQVHSVPWLRSSHLGVHWWLVEWVLWMPRLGLEMFMNADSFADVSDLTIGHSNLSKITLGSVLLCACNSVLLSPRKMHCRPLGIVALGSLEQLICYRWIAILSLWRITLQVGGRGGRGSLCNLCGQRCLGGINWKCLQDILGAKEKGKCEHIVGCE